MKKFLNDIRSAENPISGNRKIINIIAILFLGIALGTFSKFLDFRQAELPSVLMAIDGALDVHNFLGRFAIWVLIALCISIYSNSAIRASVNVFCVFCWHGCKLLFVFKLCRRLFPKKLRYDLGWLYHDFSVLGICLLVCERKKQTCIYAISIDFSSIV